MGMLKTGNMGEFSLSNREHKLTVIKSLRMSEVLLRMIANECEIRKLGFSDYMREAAMAAMKRHISPQPLATACPQLVEGDIRV
jgi:hypothetical protein